MKGIVVCIIAVFCGTALFAACTAPAAPKVQFPEKGKTANVIVAFPAGGSTDIQARLTAPYLEKQLGIPVQVVNKGGAGGQLGTTDLVNSKPDGYNITATAHVTIITTYLDPSRAATYSGKDLQHVALQAEVPLGLAVNSDGPYKTLKEFVDAAKANPGKVTVSVGGVLSDVHLGAIEFQRAAGVKLSAVQFEGTGPAVTALLGGHVDANVGTAAALLPQIKSGKLRLLGLMEKERAKLYPDLPTLKEQGYDAVIPGPRGWSMAAGTPKEIVDTWAKAIKTSMDDPELNKKMEESGMIPHYLGPEDFTKYVNDVEAQMKPLVKAALDEAASEAPKK